MQTHVCFVINTCNKRLHIATLAEMIWDSGTHAHPMYSGVDLAGILGGRMGGSIRLGWGREVGAGMGYPIIPPHRGEVWALGQVICYFCLQNQRLLREACS